MSLFGMRYRLQEANPDNGGGNDGAWKTAFGAEAAPALKDFKSPADFIKSFNDRGTEVTTLKASAGKFDWRKELAGDDPEAGKALARFADPKTFLKTFTEAQTKIRSGELAKPLAKDAKPEEVAEWRKANGIPEKADSYFEKLPEGLVIGKDDAPLFSAFAKDAHAANYSTDQVHAAVKWYYGMEQAQAQAERDVDAAERQKTITTLRTEWADDYKPNMAVMESWLDGLGKEGKALFKDAILGDGTRLMNNPAAIKWLVAQARTINPAAGLIPAGGEGDMKTVQTEIEKIEKVMKTDRKKYNNDAGMQETYRKLLTAREKLATQSK